MFGMKHVFFCQPQGMLVVVGVLKEIKLFFYIVSKKLQIYSYLHKSHYSQDIKNVKKRIIKKKYFITLICNFTRLDKMFQPCSRHKDKIK